MDCGQGRVEQRMNPTDVMVRRMEPPDVRGVVQAHLGSFRDFFLTFLGAGFLKVLYSFFMEDTSSIAIVATIPGNKIIGFVAGTSEPKGFYSRAIKKSWWRFAFASMPACIKKPIILPRLVRALRKPRESGELPGDCELMSIGVLPIYKGLGIGKMLEERFVEEARKKGSNAIELTTDRDGNESTNRFYLSRGYMLHDSFSTPEGRKMNRYVKHIKVSHAS